ncbi:MAG TPA: hypothetical protein VFP33_06100 [Gallionella sp.]|nr:hypothetical protein [Gallionella sp.]
MPTVRLKGPGLNLWFAEMLVKDHGAEQALENTSGPMRAAVEAVIAQQTPSPAPSSGEKRSEEQ